MNTRVVDAVIPILVRQRHVKVWSGELTGLSSLTFKKTKPSKGILIRDHLLQRDNNPSFDEFTILPHRNKKYS